MQISQRKAGILLNYINEAIRIITALVYTPVMLRLLGQSEYGLYQLVGSVVSYLSLLSLGFGSAYVRYHSRYHVREDAEGVARLNGMFMIIFCTMSALCLLCGGIMTANAERIFGNGLTGSELATAKVLLSVLVVNMALTFPNSVFDCYVTAHEQFIFQKLLRMMQSILNPFLTLPLLLLGYGSVAVVMITTVLTVVVFVFNAVYCVRKLHMRFLFHGLQFSLLKEMWTFTFFIFLSQIIDQVNWNVDKFLLGRMRGTTAVAVYGVGGQINNLFLALTSSIPGFFTPQLNRIVAKNEKDADSQINNLMIKMGRIIFMIVLYVYVGFLFCGKGFIYLWAGAEYNEAYYVTLWLISPLVLILPNGMGIQIRYAKNMNIVPTIFMAVTTFFNLLISIPLGYYKGATGCALGTCISLLTNYTFVNYYYIKKVNLDICRLLHNQLNILMKCSVPVLLGVTGLHFDNFGLCIIWAIIYSVIYVTFLYRFAMNEEEKHMLSSLVLKFRRQNDCHKKTIPGGWGREK